MKLSCNYYKKARKKEVCSTRERERETDEESRRKGRPARRTEGRKVEVENIAALGTEGADADRRTRTRTLPSLSSLLLAWPAPQFVGCCACKKQQKRYCSHHNHRPLHHHRRRRPHRPHYHRRRRRRRRSAALSPSITWIIDFPFVGVALPACLCMPAALSAP